MMVFNYQDFVVGRNYGFNHRAGSRWESLGDGIERRLYQRMSVADPIRDSAYHGGENQRSTGGIFNLEFNEDGSLVGAACERKCILLLDPTTRRTAHQVENAHGSSVNCIRFLDSRIFATCSDDTTVCIWDSRYLKCQFRKLEGHTNLVKNIEYSRRNNLLVTSGFDGSICSWDLNKYSDENPFNRVFYTNGLMRMRLTPSGDKMVISTMNCYLMIIHDLNLETIKEDLDGFKPNMYRLMQISGRPLVTGSKHTKHTKLFHAKRNRVEFIEDFPEENDAEIISSLLIHPEGWAAVSRNVSTEDSSEWCCVHDIHSYKSAESEDELLDRETNLFPTKRRRSPPSGMERLAAFLAAPTRQPEVEIQDPASPPAPQEGNEEEDERQRQRRASFIDLFGSIARIAGLRNENNAESSNESEEQPSQDEERPSAAERLSPPVQQPSTSRRTQRYSGFLVLPDGGDAANPSAAGGSIYYFGLAPNGQASASTLPTRRLETSIPPEARLHLNRPRLTHYIEESNQGRGFIKEICFSPDGRVIGSPFGFGIRLLAFDEECNGMDRTCGGLYEGRDDYPTSSRKLVELSTLAGYHEDVVLSSAFSPHDYSLVTGCYAGKIVWHQPVI